MLDDYNHMDVPHHAPRTQVGYLMQEGELDWSGLIHKLMARTGQIDDSVRLGSKVNEWAKVRAKPTHAIVNFLRTCMD